MSIKAVLVASFIALAAHSPAASNDIASELEPLAPTFDFALDTSTSRLPDNAERDEELVNLFYVGCNDEQKEILRWAVKFKKAAAKQWNFQQCLSGAVKGRQPLFTFQESLTVGPYRTCKPFSLSLSVTDPDYLEPEFVYEHPNLGFESALRVALSRNPMVLKCVGSLGGSTATSGPDEGYDHSAPETVNLSLRVFTEFPDHQTGWIDERFGTLFPRYPIDEIAGIILHEQLHTHSFEHGQSSENQCNYGTYECNNAMSGTTQASSCRFNSLNEIAEACMSEIIESSVGWCPFPCPDANMVPIINRMPHGSSMEGTPCICVHP